MTLLARVTAPLLIGLVIAVNAYSQTVSIYECGQMVSGDGVLAGDLNCSGHTEGPAVVVTGTLKLAGFTVIGAPMQPVVSCTLDSDCRVNGPGKLEGGLHGVWALASRSCSVRRLEIVQSAQSGIYGQTTKVSRSVVRSAGDRGIVAARLRIRHSEVLGSGSDGVYVTNSITASGLVIRDSMNGGISVEPLAESKIAGSLIEENLFGIRFGSSGLDNAVRLTKTTVRNNENFGVGAVTGLVEIRKSQIGSNGESGIWATAVRSVRSSIVGNCLAPDHDAETCCADVESEVLPELTETECQTSSESYGPECTTWDVCSLD